MEVAGDEPGDGPVTDRSEERSEAPSGGRSRLTALVVVLAVLALVGGFLAFREWQRVADAEADAERYAEVQRAANATALALLNVDYRKPEETIAAVEATSTADFAKEFASASDGLVELTTEARSVMTADVIWTGVVEMDGGAATVIVATGGQVSNAQTGDEPAARNFRLKLDLVRDGDAWKTSALDFVEVPL